MKRNQTTWFINSRGFTLVELLIVMAIFIIVIAIGTKTFTLLLRQSTQQNKVTESQVERIAGYEMLRKDIASAGFGLPWSFQNTINYSEAVNTYPASSLIPDPSTYNDAPAGVPRAILSGNNVGINGSDYLVIKATSLGTSAAASKWSYITQGTTSPKSWVGSGGSDLADGKDKVIVIAPQVSTTALRQLVMKSSAPFYYTTYSSAAFPSSFSPVSPGDMYLIYGVDSTAALSMPFNRVDYFISQDSSLLPSYCAPHTGVLVRAYVSQSNGLLNNPPLPILDCVADMQVVYQMDPNANGNLAATDDISNSGTYTAQQIAQQLKEVDIYLLTHEGKQDPNFSYTGSNPVAVGPAGLGSAFDLSASIGSGWQHYRWKVQTLIVKPKNLY